MSEPRELQSKDGAREPSARMRDLPGPASRALAALDAETEPTPGQEDRAWRRLRRHLGEADAPTRSGPVQRWLVVTAALAGLSITVVVGVGQRRRWAQQQTIAAATEGSATRPSLVDNAAAPPTIAAPAPPAALSSDAVAGPNTAANVPPPASEAVGARALPAQRVRLGAHIAVTARPSTSATAWVDHAGGQHVELTGGTVAFTVSGSVHPTLVVHAGDYHFRDQGTIFEVGRAGPAIWLQVKAGAVAVSKGGRTLVVVRGKHRWSVGSTDVASSGASGEDAPPPAPPATPATAATTAASSPHPTLPGCRALEQQQRDDEAQTCLRALGDGDDLKAETALYELARLQRERLGDATAALVTLQSERRRFPDGALRDEAELTTIELLPQVGRYRSALDLSDSFLARHPRHERAAELHLLRGNILREAFADYGAAVREYEEVDAPAGGVADDAGFFLAVALEAVGRPQDAADAYRRYLKRRAPAHAVVARERLAALAR